MAYTNYTIVPVDQVVIIDGQAAHGVDMTGIPTDVNAIQWYGLRGTGTIEYKVDPTTGQPPNSDSFTDDTIYSAQTTEAEAIIYAWYNPVTYYVTISEVIYDGQAYEFGSAITIRTPNPVQPADTTSLVPPTPEDWQELFWYNNAWVTSSVNPAASLADAQSALIKEIRISAAVQGAIQAQIHSPAQLFAAADVGLLPTADYSGYDLGSYQTFLDGQVTTMEATVNAATQVSDLYNFNPTVDGSPP